MRPPNCLRIGSRGSELALWQSRLVESRLRALFPDWVFPLEVIRTSGDRIQDRALYRVEDKGFFTKEIEEALLEERCDLAVHSLKDLPTESPPGLIIGAIPEREDPRDLWISRDRSGIMEIAAGSVVGTSSLRRTAQLRALRPDLVYRDLRGNVPTRLRKLESGDYDAVVLARAGLSRLGLIPEGAQPIPMEQILPAPGQGALAIQIRAADEIAARCVSPLNDRPARLAVAAERAFLGRLQGGCLVPVGAYSELSGSELRLRGMVADLSGDPIIRAEVCGAADGPLAEQAAAELGVRLAEEILQNGAEPVLARVRAELRRSRVDAEAGDGGGSDS